MSKAKNPSIAVLKQAGGADRIGYGNESVGRGLDKRAQSVLSVEALVSLPSPRDGSHYEVTGYHLGNRYGGGHFIFDAGEPKAGHNGGTVIDPDRPFPVDWSVDDDVVAWFTPAETGTGCFVRVGEQDYILSQFGAIRGGDYDASRPWDAVVGALPGLGAASAALKPSIMIDGAFRIDRGGLSADQDKIRYVRFVGREAMTSRIRYYGAEPYMLDYPGEGMRFYSIAFENKSGGSRRMLRTSLPDKADVDAVFNDCYSRGFECLHHCYGRGHTNVDCHINTGVMCLIESPDPYNEGPFPNTQATETGMRRYVSNNLQVDSARAVFEVSPAGPAADFINEMTIIGTNGNSLGCLVDGGEIQMLTVKTGSLVNSFTNNYPVKCRALRKANIEVSGLTFYNRDNPTVEVGETVLGYLKVSQGAPSDQVLIDDVKISGLLSNVRQNIVTTDGYIKNLTISGLELPGLWEYSDLSIVQLVGCQGADPEGRIKLNSVTFGGDLFGAERFEWSLNYPVKQFMAGVIDTGIVPVKKLVKNRGLATVPDTDNSVKVEHGLAYTPLKEQITITPMSSGVGAADFYVSVAYSTEFIIQMNVTPASPKDFSWVIDREQV